MFEDWLFAKSESYRFLDSLVISHQLGQLGLSPRRRLHAATIGCENVLEPTLFGTIRRASALEALPLRLHLGKALPASRFCWCYDTERGPFGGKSLVRCFKSRFLFELPDGSLLMDDVRVFPGQTDLKILEHGAGRSELFGGGSANWSPQRSVGA